MIPRRYTISSFTEDHGPLSVKRSVQTIKGTIWVPARPESWFGFGLITRIKLAFAVFTGKYDVLDWEEDRIAKAEQEYADANNPPEL